MQRQKEQKKGRQRGRPRSAGKHSEKYQSFFSVRLAEKKLRHVLHHSGVAAATLLAKERGEEKTLARLLENLPARVERREQKRLAAVCSRA